MPQTPARLISATGGPKHWIILRIPIRFAEGGSIIPGSLIVVPFGWFGDRVLFPSTWIWWLLLGLGVTTACWLPFLRGLTNSVRNMELATSEIAHGRFNTRLNVTRRDEIGRLAASIETMASRLDALVSGQKRFLGDSAHELRSPLGRMQVALEILKGRVAEPERGYVDDLQEDVEALSRLTDDLLQFARAELADRTGTQQAVHLAPLIDRIVSRERGAASITITVDPAISVTADPALLERAIANVIRNAVTYAAEAGPIQVGAAANGDRVLLSVADQGQGVAPESVSRLFEPFFREDQARNRRTGGVGLGLAIVRSAIEACGGTVNCANRVPNGLEVRMDLRQA